MLYIARVMMFLLNFASHAGHQVLYMQKVWPSLLCGCYINIRKERFVLQLWRARSHRSGRGKHTRLTYLEYEKEEPVL